MNNIDHNVDVALGSIDTICRASAPPFFFARVQSRLRRNEDSMPNRLIVLLSRPITVCLILVCILIIDFFAVAESKKNTYPISDGSEQQISIEKELDDQAVYYVDGNYSNRE
jgi:hypothetical protein